MSQAHEQEVYYVTEKGTGHDDDAPRLEDLRVRASNCNTKYTVSWGGIKDFYYA